MATKYYPMVGERVTVEMPYSDVCAYMGVACKRMLAELTEHGTVQLYTLDGKQFSFPILPGEAGFYMGENGEYYTYVE